MATATSSRSNKRRPHADTTRTAVRRERDHRSHALSESAPADRGRRRRPRTVAHSHPAPLAVPPGPTAAAPHAAPALAALSATSNSALSLSEAQTKFEAATTYNNFYEFGVNKDDPSRLGHTLRPRPWTVQVDGFVGKPKTFDIDELIRLFPLEERVYSLRCVEAWSMVIPWIGFPLASLLKRVEPTGQAKFVEFTTLLDPNQFPAQ